MALVRFAVGSHGQDELDWLTSSKHSVTHPGHGLEEMMDTRLVVKTPASAQYCTV